MKIHKILHTILLNFIIFSGVLSNNVYASTMIKADAVVEKQSVFVGETFIFQIQVSGSENPDKPDLSHLRDFNVQYQGGQQNSSRSVTILNGKMTRNVREGYFFSYRLTPKKAGVLTIPSISVYANGQKAETAPVRIKVNKPMETDNFKLRMELSKSTCYVGEPITLTVTFYLDRTIEELAFNVPLFDKTDKFYFADPEININDGGKYYRIPIGANEVIAKEGSGFLEGRKYSTISFKRILIPKDEGLVKIENAMANCMTLIGYRQSRRNDFDSFFNDDVFSDFFSDSFFGSGRKGEYKKVVVPSNSLVLKVLPVPLKDQPENFMGHIGEYKISAVAKPTDVSVGDPITLQIILSGPEYLEHVKFPPLDKQASLLKDFKIPKEMADGEVSGNSKIFTQTIRALNTSVKEIPPIELCYFDTKLGQYEVVRSKSIPLTVKEAKIITADDAEGIGIIPPAKNDLETWKKGIAYNYDDMSVLDNQYFGILSSFKSPVLFLLITIPPFLYSIVLVWVSLMKRYKADPLLVNAKKAYGILNKSLMSAGKTASENKIPGLILDSIRKYLSDKLRIPGGSLTFYDVEGKLKAKNVDRDTLDNLKKLFDYCEKGRYAGNTDIGDSKSLLDMSFNITKKMEKELK